MSREIKFRSWNKKNQKMQKDLTNTVCGVTCPTYLNHALKHIQDDYILMQFTGLKDNTKWEQLTEDEQRAWIDDGKTKEQWNGKEIYEGDICKHKYYNNEKDLAVFSWDNELLTFKANIYSDGIECENVFFIDTDSSKFEVIGNIYENQELLK